MQIKILLPPILRRAAEGQLLVISLMMIKSEPAFRFHLVTDERLGSRFGIYKKT